MEMHFAGPPGCLVRLQKTTCCGARRTARFWVHAAQPPVLECKTGDWSKFPLAPTGLQKTVAW